MADDNMNETISALMDGELDEHEMERAIRELHNSPEQRHAWQRYHLIGDALRNNIPAHLDGSFASRVSQAIADEVAPSSSVVPFQPKPQTPAQPRSSLLKPVAGFALAASVAVVAYLGVGMISVDEQGSVPPLASNEPQVVVPATPATMTQPMMPLSGIQTVQGQRWNAATPAVESKLNTYLYDHNTMSSVTVMNSRMLPSIRFVESRPLQGE